MEQVQQFVVVLIAVLTHPIGASVFGSVVKALRDDWIAFQKFESYLDAKAYRWDVAAWKAFKGAVVGFVAGVGLWLTALGLGAMVG